MATTPKRAATTGVIAARNPAILTPMGVVAILVVNMIAGTQNTVRIRAGYKASTVSPLGERFDLRYKTLPTPLTCVEFVSSKVLYAPSNQTLRIPRHWNHNPHRCSRLAVHTLPLCHILPPSNMPASTGMDYFELGCAADPNPGPDGGRVRGKAKEREETDSKAECFS